MGKLGGWKRWKIETYRGDLLYLLERTGAVGLREVLMSVIVLGQYAGAESSHPEPYITLLVTRHHWRSHRPKPASPWAVPPATASERHTGLHSATLVLTTWPGYSRNRKRNKCTGSLVLSISGLTTVVCGLWFPNLAQHHKRLGKKPCRTD